MPVWLWASSQVAPQGVAARSRQLRSSSGARLWLPRAVAPVPPPWVLRSAPSGRSSTLQQGNCMPLHANTHSPTKHACTLLPHTSQAGDVRQAPSMCEAWQHFIGSLRQQTEHAGAASLERQPCQQRRLCCLLWRLNKLRVSARDSTYITSSGKRGQMPSTEGRKTGQRCRGGPGILPRLRSTCSFTSCPELLQAPGCSRLKPPHRCSPSPQLKSCQLDITV